MSEQTQIQATRHTMDELIVYDVSETELNILETGTIESKLFNISIFLLSIFVSYLPVLILTPMQNEVYIIFLILDIVAGIVGVILIILVRHFRTSSSNIFIQIKSRKKTPVGIQEVTDIQVS